MSLEKRKGQEEIVGFAMIIIVVAVILLVFLSISLREPQKEDVESYEVSNFIQAMLQYTTDCRDSGNLEYRSIQKLIFDCDDKEICLDGRDSCEVLKSALEGWVGAGWKTPKIKGYVLNISFESGKIVMLEEGEITGNYKGSEEYFSRSDGSSIDILFTAYY